MSGIISKTECIEIVRKSFKDEVFCDRWIKSFTVEQVSEGLVGFMGEYYKLIVELEDNDVDGDSHLGMKSFFVKSVPISNEIFRKECLDKGFFIKETQLYRNLLGEVQKYASKKLYPECYYTRPDLLVLEDLSTQSLRHITNSDEISMDFFKVVLKTQAHLHAASIAYELDKGINIGTTFKDVFYELQLSMKNVWCVTGIKSIISLAKMIPNHNPQLEGFINNKLYDVLCSACRLTDSSDVYRNVLCHRDSWTRNIFFECDKNDIPIDCLIFDFQLTRYSPPAIDVLYLISMATRRQQRLSIQDECLEYYYATFVEIMKDMGMEKEIFSREEFLDSCHHLELAVLLLKAICAPLMAMPEGLTNKMRAEEPERFDYYLNEDRDELFLRIMEMDPGYKEVILEPVEELLEYLRGEFQL